MTSRRVVVAAALVAMLLGAAAYFVVSPAPPTTTTKSGDVAAPRTEVKSPETRPAQRKRGADKPPTSPESETAPADDALEWPIRVTTNVPGATVTMELTLYGGDPDPAPETKTTDAKGFVGFAAPAKEVPVRRFEFIALAEGWEPTRDDLRQPGDVRIEMKPRVAVRGRVTDDTGRPISGATFVLSTGAALGASVGDYMEVLLAVTTADGSFKAFVEQPGALKFRVDHAAFLSREVAATAPAAELVVVLERGLEVSGRVAFPDGRPVPGIAMTEDSGRLRAATDADGRYVASGLQRGPFSLRCDLAAETRTVEAGATNVDFVVKRSLARIRYLDEKGRPFRYAGMSVRLMKGDEVLEMRAGEGPADGVDLMDGPPGAQVLVSASSPDGRTGSGKATFDDVPRLHDIDVVLGAKLPTGTIRLLVRWESPETPRTVYVDVTDEMGATVAGGGRKRCDLDAAASVDIPNVPAGRVKVTVAAAAHWSPESLDTLLVTATPSATVEVGRTAEVVATLAVGGRVRATVRDEAGKPVAPHVVRLLAASDGRMLDMFVHRNADGGWTTELDTSPSVLLDAVAPGRYVVEAESPSGEKGRKEIDVVRGETVDVEVVVRAAAK